MLPYTVRRSPSILAAADDFFFDEKVLCVRRGDRYPDANPAYGVRQKTCSRNLANAFYNLFTVRRFFVGSPLFCSCSRIVYSGLYSIHEYTYAGVYDVPPVRSASASLFQFTKVIIYIQIGMRD